MSDGDNLLLPDAYELQKRSHHSSRASINELSGEEADKSFQRTGEVVRLSKCEDEEFIANAYRYCKRCLRGNWAKCPPEKFSVNYVSGGLTNYLYLCNLPEDIELLPNEPRKVLIRIHGEIVDQKQRFYEGVVFTLLSERGFGPRTYGIFFSGRIEEFIPHRHLYTEELADPTLSKLIAHKLGKYHCMNLPLNKEPVFLWENFEKYISMVHNAKLENKNDQEIYKCFMKDINIDAEYDWLRSMLLQLNAPVVFGHNDLQEGNILHLEQDILIIDYDYSSYNYRGYDIGNHFCEWIYEYSEEHEGGYKIFPDAYPKEEQQILFAKVYLQSVSEVKDKFLSGQLTNMTTICPFETCSVEELLFEANRFALASHLFWALWSIIQGQVSKIDFSYVKYAKDRLDGYLQLKKDLGY